MMIGKLQGQHTQITELVFIGIEKAPDVSGAFFVYAVS
jgi:hypothetical protein